MGVGATTVTPQTVQYVPPSKPISRQVGATSLNATSLCPRAGVSFCATITSPHLLQCEPAERPVVVHVAGTDWSKTFVCLHDDAVASKHPVNVMESNATTTTTKSARIPLL